MKTFKIQKPAASANGATAALESGVNRAESSLNVEYPKDSSKPRLGFLGVGWIGRHRMKAVAASREAEIVAVADASASLASDAAAENETVALNSLDALLELDLDGIVIATPSALHAEQAIAALERGVAVFCQKPLGRTADETRRVVNAARAANRLLGVDLSYRHIEGVRKIRDLCRSGELGEIFVADLTFHNAYGPDKPWFYDWKLSGGGCVIDLGIHLVDTALWALGFPAVTGVTSRLFAGGKAIRGRRDSVEDYAVAQLDLATGGTVNIACSWKLPAGCDAIISGSFYGTKGGAAFHNVDGSFYDFRAERFRGTKSEALATSPEDWGGRAIVEWSRRLAGGQGFDSANVELVRVAETLDRIYEGHLEGGRTGR